MMFLMKVLEPYGLQALGRLIAFSGLAGMIIQPLWQSIKFFRTPGRASKMKRKNVLTSLVVASAVIVGIAYIPFPYHVDCAVEIQPHDAQQVFAMVPGRLISWNKKPGDPVQAGEPIAQLDNIDLQLQRVRQTSEYEMAINRYRTLVDQQHFDPQAKAQLDTQAELVMSKKAMVDKVLERINMLTITAKEEGVIMPPPAKPVAKQAESEEQLPAWSGNPFDTRNSDAYFSESDLLCLIGDPKRMEAVLIVDQHDIDLVSEGMEADIKIESARLETFSGIIEKISEMEMTVAPEQLGIQAGGKLDTEMDSTGRLRPISTSYQARVPLENIQVPLRPGYRGQAKIYVGWKSLGWRIYRFFARTFRLEM
jgi:putative peptide zinc metalloprotease protein